MNLDKISLTFFLKKNIDNLNSKYWIEWLYTLFDSIKKEDKNGKINYEDFINLWIYKIKAIWKRVVKWWEKYILKSENAHKVSILEKTSTIFISDITYRIKWYKKINSNVMRWHVKKYPLEQDKVEERNFFTYYKKSELKNILVYELNKLINNYK